MLVTVDLLCDPGQVSPPLCFHLFTYKIGYSLHCEEGKNEISKGGFYVVTCLGFSLVYLFVLLSL